MAYRGGTIDVEGTVDAGGESGDFLESLRAEGSLRGRSIQIAPDTEFRAVSGAFTTQGFGPESKVAPESYTLDAALLARVACGGA